MRLTTREIAYLMPSFTERTSIGLFSNIKAKPDGTEYQSLMKKGVIQGNGYAPGALEILLHIASPQRCGRVIVKNDCCVIEKYTYWKNGKKILAENINGEFVFSNIYDPSDIIIGLSDFFSMSNIKTADVSVILPPDEMIVLLAIIDIYRKNTLLNYAGKTNESEFIILQEITSELTSGFENGLVKIFVNNYDFKIPSAVNTESLLTNLIRKGALEFKKGYRLTNDLTLLANSFLIPQAIVLFEAFDAAADGNLSVDGGLCVAAGIHDILSFAVGENEVKLFTLSAFQMLSAVENALECPSVFQDTEQNAPAPVPDNSAWQCQCGTTNAGNFCSSCGRKRQ